MSAIAGLWRFDGKPDVQADCARMLASQEIYGPHDGRAWSQGPLAMGRRLYRTLPEDVHDRQPLQSRDENLTLVADVRLDNRDELVISLGMTAEQARQLCDAAILLECWVRWGEGSLERLAGDFAFALWDKSARKLFLARDGLGRRPLHYHRARNFFAFASMPKGLHALPDIPYAPDQEMTAEFLALMPADPQRSFFKGINRVQPGHVLTVMPDNQNGRRHWEPQRPGSDRLSDDDYAEGLRHHLDQAVRARLRGAGDEVASMLSSGFDSGAVTATAARLMAPCGKVVAFTAVPRAGYAGRAPRNRFGDEGPLAAITAGMYPNVEHVPIRSDDISPLENLDRYFFLFEQPLLNLCNSTWSTAICHAARQRKLGIMLGGAMGNMSLSYAGYELLPELLRAGRLISLARNAADLVGKTELRWRGVLVQTFGPFMPPGSWRWLNWTFAAQDMENLNYTALREEQVRQLDARARARDLDFTYRPRKDGFDTRLWVRCGASTGATASRAAWPPGGSTVASR